MRLTQLAREALASARAQKTPTTLVAILVAAMCATTLLTVGRAAAAEAQVNVRMESAGSRHLQVTDAKAQDFLTATVVGQAAQLSTVERAVGFGTTVDVASAAMSSGGSTIPAWTVVGQISDVVTLVAGRWPEPGEALVSTNAQDRLGFDAPVGAVTAAGTGLVETAYPVVGRYEARDPYNDLITGVVIAAPTGTTARTLDVIAAQSAGASLTQRAVLALLNRTDPADLSIQSPATLAEVQEAVLGDLARFNRSLTLLVLGAGALLVAVVALADVLLHRTDLGRRRALGAPRWALTTLVVGRTAIGGLLGAVVGTAIATTWTMRAGQPLDLTFIAAVAALSVLCAATAALPPAMLAAFQDPVRVLRTP